MIREDIIERIKEENEIIDIISESGVRLKRSGNNYFGLCPFHNEKSPSFSVSPNKQIFKCFGCGEAGNVISYVMKNKNLTYVDALRFLAERVNISIDDDKKNTTQNQRRQKLIDINTEVARYYFSNLSRSPKAKEYLLNRGLSINSIKRFGLGYSEDQWSDLYKYLIKKGYKIQDLLTLGVIIQGKNNNNYYDRFRNRIMFPVFNSRGEVIGFGGRVLDDSKPKYLNSPESEIFNKGTNLYGLNFAIKQGIKDYIIIVEGYMDVISLNQNGVTNVVASLGTALTLNQAKLMKKYASKVVISYDADFAGQNATLRGLKILKDVGFEIKVLKIPQGKDPDEYVRSNGKEAFLRLIDNSLDLTEYILNSTEEKYDLSKSEEKIKYLQEVSNILKELDAIERDIYIKRISEKTDINEHAIYDKLDEVKNTPSNLEQNVNKMDNVGHKLYLEQGYIKAERAILRFMIFNDEYYNYIIKKFDENHFILDAHKKIFNIIVKNKEEKFHQITKILEIQCDDPDSMKEYIYIMEEVVNVEDCDAEELIDDYILVIKKASLEIKKNKLTSEIKKLEAAGKIVESIEIAKEIEEIQRKLKKL
ncbi:MAG: DNA primase [Clostridiaceae bacterium]